MKHIIMSHSSTAHTLDTFTLPQPIQADNVSDLSSVMFGALCLFFSAVNGVIV